MGNIFVVAACTAGKGRQGRLFVGKIFVVRPPTTKTTNIWPHENYTLYGIAYPAYLSDKAIVQINDLRNCVC